MSPSKSTTCWKPSPPTEKRKLRGRTPRRPVMEALTPEPDDLSSSQKEFTHAEKMLAEHLRLPLNLHSMINAILQLPEASHASHALDDNLRAALSKMSIQEQQRIRWFADILHHHCEVLSTGSPQMSKDSHSTEAGMDEEKEEEPSPDSSPQQPLPHQAPPMHSPAETPDEIIQEEERKEPSSSVQRTEDVAPHNTPAVACQERQACKSAPLSAQPSGTEKKESMQSPPKQMEDDVASHTSTAVASQEGTGCGSSQPSTQPSGTEKEESMQSPPEQIKDDVVSHTSTAVASQEGSGCGPSQPCTQPSGTEEEESMQSPPEQIQEVVSHTSTAVARQGRKASGTEKPVLLETEPQSASETKANTTETTSATTPQRKPLPGQAKQAKQATWETLDLSLVKKPVQELINASWKRVSSFCSQDQRIATETHDALLSMINSKHEENLAWSDGSEWRSLLEAGHTEQWQGTFRHALIVMGFTRWHASQVSILRADSKMNKREASSKVTDRIVGTEPKKDGQKEEWLRQRKNISTDLDRGCKWIMLTDKFGLGIFLENPWQLAKASKNTLDTLINELPNCSERISLLQLLTEQMTLLQENGKMDEKSFLKGLRSKKLPQPVQVREGLSIKPEFLKDRATANTLFIKDQKIRVDKEAIEALKSTAWLSDSVIMACLHLCDRLPFVRVGFSVPIHQQRNSHKRMPRPFEMAVKKIAAWHNEAEGSAKLVSFFPLFLNQNHFTLLEVNERDGCIYHYDSLSEVGTVGFDTETQGDEVSDVEEACKNAFPAFEYVKQAGLQQDDTHSCGAIVIRHARYRMMGLPVPSGRLDRASAKQLRSEALDVLASAWQSGKMINAPQPSKKRTNAGGDVRGSSQKKRKTGS
ncbi:unnamed protein product [Clonostachys rhizophaga]|uniref:Ubiquitin-like protease family profile domain-containing protein n=1 Tax=Clonostachys rhizophaga TaxID=160324 RepID=A0A9N9V9C9_9HYPO|nr:unnamed protein product [Clonostachys rhizophaga]